MILDEILEAKLKFLKHVKPKYIELYGELEPDILFIGKSLIEHGFSEAEQKLGVQVVFVEDDGHIAWHKKKHIDDLIRCGKDGSEDIGYSLTEWYKSGTPKPADIFNDVFCDFEIKAYIEQCWQPDWSQAPEWAKWWCMEKSGDAFWFYEKPVKSLGDGWTLGGSSDLNIEAPTFSYKGNWQDSLRSRDTQ